MTIGDIRKNTILPFEVDDLKLRKLFSFFLHSAPTIESSTAIAIPKDRLLCNWENFLSNHTLRCNEIMSPNVVFSNALEKYRFCDSADVSRTTSGFLCKRKQNAKEMDCEVLLRHLRNSIAHNYVYIANTSNRVYILFIDYNKSKNQNARILFSRSDLQDLRKTIKA